MADRIFDKEVIELNTIDATPTTFKTYTPPLNSVVKINVNTVGKTSAGTGLVLVQTGGIARGTGAPSSMGFSPSYTGGIVGTVTVTISGNDVLFRATGIAATVIDWMIEIQYQIY